MTDRNRKQNKSFIIFFWDYDTQWGADRSRNGTGFQGELEFTNTDRLLDLHARYEVPACFAVVGAAALPGRRPYHDPAQIRIIHDAGHEVASHSMHHDWLPGLGRSELLETLRKSRSSLQECIGAPVVTFVPPYNQPFDYLRGFSISLSERRAHRNGKRTDLQQLCETLYETGYRFSRVSYRPVPVRLAEKILSRRLDSPGLTRKIAEVTCVRLNAPCGFAAGTMRMLDRVINEGGILVVYGHPHSLRSGNTQDEMYLKPFLEKVNSLKRSGSLEVVLPRDMVEAGV